MRYNVDERYLVIINDLHEIDGGDTLPAAACMTQR